VKVLDTTRDDGGIGGNSLPSMTKYGRYDSFVFRDGVDQRLSFPQKNPIPKGLKHIMIATRKDFPMGEVKI